MKPVNKSKRQGIQARPPHKASEDFLRWLKQKNDLKKEAAGQTAQDHAVYSRALMVWADDGGSTE